jgi:hypothetical protein
MINSVQWLESLWYKQLTINKLGEKSNKIRPNMVSVRVQLISDGRII